MRNVNLVAGGLVVVSILAACHAAREDDGAGNAAEAAATSDTLIKAGEEKKLTALPEPTSVDVPNLQDIRGIAGNEKGFLIVYALRTVLDPPGAKHRLFAQAVDLKGDQKENKPTLLGEFDDDDTISFASDGTDFLVLAQNLTEPTVSPDGPPPEENAAPPAPAPLRGRLVKGSDGTLLGDTSPEPLVFEGVKGRATVVFDGKQDANMTEYSAMWTDSEGKVLRQKIQFTNGGSSHVDLPAAPIGAATPKTNLAAALLGDTLVVAWNQTDDKHLVGVRVGNDGPIDEAFPMANGEDFGTISAVADKDRVVLSTKAGAFIIPKTGEVPAQADWRNLKPQRLLADGKQLLSVMLASGGESGSRDYEVSRVDSTSGKVFSGAVHIAMGAEREERFREADVRIASAGNGQSLVAYALLDNNVQVPGVGLRTVTSTTPTEETRDAGRDAARDARPEPEPEEEYHPPPEPVIKGSATVTIKPKAKAEACSTNPGSGGWNGMSLAGVLGAVGLLFARRRRSDSES